MSMRAAGAPSSGSSLAFRDHGRDVWFRWLGGRIPRRHSQTKLRRKPFRSSRSAATPSRGGSGWMTRQSDRDRVGSKSEGFAAQVQAARRNRELIATLARWRTELGLSQAECAKRMHTSQPAVARLESHQHDAQLSTLARYVTALGLALHFVLTDSKTGTPIWTSLFGSTGLELPERVRVVEDRWTKLSEQDLIADQYVITASEEPGWSLVYKPSKKQGTLQDATLAHSGRTETAEDPRVVAFFDVKGSDPVAIATAIESEGDLVHQIHTLTAKVKEPLSGIEIPHVEVSHDDLGQQGEAASGYYPEGTTHDIEVAHPMYGILGITSLGRDPFSHAGPPSDASSTKAEEANDNS